MAKRVFITPRATYLKTKTPHSFPLKTLVLQSHTYPLPHTWIKLCIDSVKNWATANSYDYLFLGDEIFNSVDEDILEKTSSQPVIATDLARIISMKNHLSNGYDRVIWCDADFLIFAPANFSLLQEPYLLGREVWIQNDKECKLTAHIKVHNAFMMFQQGNSFLDFYIDNAKRFLIRNTGNVPPQFIGPKLLTAIHNIIQCPVLETAGMLSPSVINDIANKSGPALALFKQRSPQAITAANLCSSLYKDDSKNKKIIETTIDVLLSNQII